MKLLDTQTGLCKTGTYPSLHNNHPFLTPLIKSLNPAGVGVQIEKVKEYHPYKKESKNGHVLIPAAQWATKLAKTHASYSSIQKASACTQKNGLRQPIPLLATTEGPIALANRHSINPMLSQYKMGARLLKVSHGRLEGTADAGQKS